eukprot:5865262-Alexandrium_andersonii.AAC.1
MPPRHESGARSTGNALLGGLSLDHSQDASAAPPRLLRSLLAMALPGGNVGRASADGVPLHSGSAGGWAP